MKKLLSIFILSLLFIGNVFSKKITISTGEYPPFESEKSKGYGPVPRITTSALKNVGIIPEYIFYPWKRAYSVSKRGEVDASLQWFYSEERQKHHFYSDAVIIEKVAWYHSKDMKFSWKTLSDLKKYKIVAVDGYTYTKDFYIAIKEKRLDVEFVGTTKQALEMLINKRVDLFPESPDVGVYQLKKYFPESADKITYNKNFLRTSPSYLIFNKSRPGAFELVERFNKGLRILKESGKYQEILNDYYRELHSPKKQ